MKRPARAAYPPLALAARVERYAGREHPLNGAVVELGAYLPDELGQAMPFFELQLTRSFKDEDGKRWRVGEVVYAFVGEIVPLTAAAQLYVKNCAEVDYPLYAPDVYDLRDALDRVGVAVTAASIAVWTPAQRRTATSYVAAVARAEERGQPPPPKPKDLS